MDADVTVAGFADDEVVEHFDAEEFAGLDGGAVAAHGGTEEVAHAGGDDVEGAGGGVGDLDDLMAGIEEHNAKGFLLEIADEGAEDGGGVGGSGDAWLFTGAGEQQATADFESGLDFGGFGGADAGDFGEGGDVGVGESGQAAEPGEEGLGKIDGVGVAGAGAQDDGEELGVGKVLGAVLGEALTRAFGRIHLLDADPIVRVAVGRWAHFRMGRKGGVRSGRARGRGRDGGRRSRDRRASGIR